MMSPNARVAAFNQRFGHSTDDVLFVRKLRELLFTTEQIAHIIQSMEDVCRHCYNAPAGTCHCWNDE